VIRLSPDRSNKTSRLDFRVGLLRGFAARAQQSDELRRQLQQLKHQDEQVAKRSWAMLLAGDIGGTKTDLAIFSVEAGPHSPLTQSEVHSADYPSLQALVTEFLKQAKTPVERACF